MGINAYCGLPGKGKTAESTYFAVKHFNIMNGFINRHATNLSYIKDSIENYYETITIHGYKFNLIKCLQFVFADYVYNNNWAKLFPNNNVFSNYPIVLNPLNKFKHARLFIKNTIHVLTKYQIREKKRIYIFLYWINYLKLFNYLYNYFNDEFVYDLDLNKWVKDEGQFDNKDVNLYTKYRIYSNVVQLADLNMIYQFPKHSFIIFDEAQRYQDSRDFASFPKALGTFLQHHRHASIDDIIFVTQHPRRLDNKIRDLCEVFRKYRMFIKIPFIPYVFASYTNYYEFEEYGKFNQLPKEARTYDYDNHFQILPTHKTFDRYESKYFSVIFDSLKQVEKQTYSKKRLTDSDIEKVGIKL